VLGALGLAQVVQLPIAAAATGVNLAAGTLDIGLGVVLGGGIALGSWSGAQAAHALPIARLRGIVAAALIAIGAAIVLEAL
jgi:uncharacterized membrane protein YfcA